VSHGRNIGSTPRSGRGSPRLSKTSGVPHVPGSRSPLYCAGALLRSHFPVSTITEGLALNITVSSYQDRATSACSPTATSSTPDGLAAAITEELDLLTASQADWQRRAAEPNHERTAR